MVRQTSPEDLHLPKEFAATSESAQTLLGRRLVLIDENGARPLSVAMRDHARRLLDRHTQLAIRNAMNPYRWLSLIGLSALALTACRTDNESRVHPDAGALGAQSVPAASSVTPTLPALKPAVTGPRRMGELCGAQAAEPCASGLVCSTTDTEQGVCLTGPLTGKRPPHPQGPGKAGEPCGGLVGRPCATGVTCRTTDGSPFPPDGSGICVVFRPHDRT